MTKTGRPNKPMLVLRCIAYPGKNSGRQGFYAICIDVNLFTWRPTLKEAKRSLEQAIGGYLETVADLAKEEKLTKKEVVKRVLRPSPFWPHKAGYYAYRLLFSFSVFIYSQFTPNDLG